MSQISTKSSPFEISISFHKYLEVLKEIRDTDPIPYRAEYANAVLEMAKQIPELYTGFSNEQVLYDNKELIRLMLSDIFPTALSHNEIKAATIPFYDITFNYTERFKSILEAAGQSFQIKLRDIDDNTFYVFNCALIIETFFKRKVRANFPMYYDIPDSSGVMRSYRITINADFTEIIPTERAKMLTDDEINDLLDNFDDIDRWKEQFPEHSWILKGFCIITLTDVTSDFAISELKSQLLSIDSESGTMSGSIEPILQSYFEIPDLKTGFMYFNEEDNKLEKLPNNRHLFSSFIIENIYDRINSQAIGKEAYEAFAKSNRPFVVSDVSKYAEEAKFQLVNEYFETNNIKSFVVIPVVSEGKLLAILEMSSGITGAFNTFKIKKLDFITPFLLFTITRFRYDWKTKLEVIIQREYTALHPSVEWKFREEAQKYFFAQLQNQEYPLKDIVFPTVYPLYAQSDIKSSSDNRNKAQQEDLLEQLDMVIDIFNQLNHMTLVQEKIYFAVQQLRKEVQTEIKADTEQRVQQFLFTTVHSSLRNQNENCGAIASIERYFQEINPDGQLLYKRRKDFDDSVTKMNSRFAELLEKREVEAQEIFPHYFELFKTDGVAHSIYIGQSIAPNLNFSYSKLKELRLWQLETIIETERIHSELKKTLPFPLDINSLILVYNLPISIRFRMDEKRFDIDGAYNSRYEVVKKRIDKSRIKNSDERITETGKITIVYSTVEDEKEYLNYITQLQEKGLLSQELENFEVENLQGITGLKAWRVAVR